MRSEESLRQTGREGELSVPGSREPPPSRVLAFQFLCIRDRAGVRSNVSQCALPLNLFLISN